MKNALGVTEFHSTDKLVHHLADLLGSHRFLVLSEVPLKIVLEVLKYQMKAVFFRLIVNFFEPRLSIRLLAC